MGEGIDSSSSNEEPQKKKNMVSFTVGSMCPFTNPPLTKNAEKKLRRVSYR